MLKTPTATHMTVRILHVLSDRAFHDADFVRSQLPRTSSATFHTTMLGLESRGQVTGFKIVGSHKKSFKITPLGLQVYNEVKEFYLEMFMQSEVASN